MASALALFNDGLWFGQVNQTNPFIPKLVLDMVFIPTIGNQAKTANLAVFFTTWPFWYMQDLLCRNPIVSQVPPPPPVTLHLLFKLHGPGDYLLVEKSILLP